MTVAKFFGYLLVLWLFLGALLYVFLRVLSLDGTLMQRVYWFLIFLITTTLIRRTGVLNYLEVFVVTVIWTGAILLLDTLFLVPALGKELFSLTFWIGVGVMAATILIFHKKRHVEIRKQHAAHHDHDNHSGGHKSHGDHHQQPHGQHPPGKH